jgi:hypothetical protein
MYRCAYLSKESERDETLKKDESESRQLLARCYLKMGQWQENLNGVQVKISLSLSSLSILSLLSSPLSPPYLPPLSLSLLF